MLLALSGCRCFLDVAIQCGRTCHSNPRPDDPFDVEPTNHPPTTSVSGAIKIKGHFAKPRYALRLFKWNSQRVGETGVQRDVLAFPVAAPSSSLFSEKRSGTDAPHYTRADRSTSVQRMVLELILR